MSEQRYLPDEPGIIDKNEEEHIPLSCKKLDSPKKCKYLFCLILFAYCASVLLIPLTIAYHHDSDTNSTHVKPVVSKANGCDKPPTKVDEAFALVFFFLFFILWLRFPLLLIDDDYDKFFYMQVVDSKVSKARRTLCLWLSLAIWMFWLVVYCSKPSPLPAFINYFAFMQFVWFLAIILFHKRYCRCKKCQDQKDVKIWHLDKCIEVIETQKLTSKFLSENLSICISSDEILALKLKNRQIIHKFKTPDSYVQLYEGRYDVELVTKYGVTIRHADATKSITYKTEFNDHSLRRWFNINSNCTIAVQNENNGEVIHAFFNKEKKITLEDGIYVLNIYKKIGNTEQFSTNNVASCGNNSTNEEKEEEKSKCTILNID